MDHAAFGRPTSHFQPASRSPTTESGLIRSHDARATAAIAERPTRDGPYTSSAMHVTTTPSEKSTLVVEVELPVDRVARAVADATRRLSQRTRVAGFRPGKAPRGMLERVLGEGAVWDEAVETLVDTSYREWAKGTADDPAIFIIGRPEVEVVEAEEGKPLRYKATVPLRPEVKLGDYANFPFKPEIDAGRRRQGGARRRRAARPAGDARPGGGARGREGRLGGHRLRRHPRRRPVRRRDRRADAARHRRGAPDPRLRGAPRRPAAGRDVRVRHHVPRRLPGGVAARRPGPLQRRAQGAAREDPARRRRRLRPVDGRLRRPGDPARRRSASGWSGTPSTGPATASPTGSSTTP